MGGLNVDLEPPDDISDLVEGIEPKINKHREPAVPDEVWNNSFYNAQLYKMREWERMTLNESRVKSWISTQVKRCRDLEKNPSQGKGMIPADRYEVLCKAKIHETNAAKKTLDTLKSCEVFERKPPPRPGPVKPPEGIEDLVPGVTVLKTHDRLWNNLFYNAQLYRLGEVDKLTTGHYRLSEWIVRQRGLCRKFERNPSIEIGLIEPTRYALLVQAEIYETDVAQETLDAVGFSGLATVKQTKKLTSEEGDEEADKKPAAKKRRTS